MTARARTAVRLSCTAHGHATVGLAFPHMSRQVTQLARVLPRDEYATMPPVSPSRRPPAAPLRWGSLVCIVVFLLSQLLSTTGTAQRAPSPEPNVRAAQLMATPTPSPPAIIQTAFSSLGFQDQTVVASRSTLSFRLPILPGTLITDGSAVTFRYRPSPQLDLSRSTLTASVNGIQRMSGPVTTPDDSGRASFTVPLNATDALASTTEVAIDLTIQLALPGLDCPPVTAPERWLVLSQTSSSSLARTDLDQGMNLGQLPDLFLPRLLETNTASQPVAAPAVTIVIGQGSAPEELEAAGLVAMQLGRWGQQRGVTPVVNYSDQIPSNQPVIVVASGQRFADRLTWGDVTWDGAVFGTPSGPVSADRGLLALQKSTVPALLVGSTSPAGVLEAARALVQPGRGDSLAGMYAVLTGRSAPVTDNRYPAWNGNVASFADLATPARVISGTDVQTTHYRFDRPAGWEFTTAAHLVLDLSVIGNLAPDASVTGTLNGVPIGGSPLLPGGVSAVATGDINQTATIQHVQFDIPASVLDQPAFGSTRRTLALDVMLSLGAGTTCTNGMPPTVTILPSSWWQLPHHTTTQLDLAQFPAPLSGDPQRGVAPLIAVLPDGPTAAEQGAALRVMTAIGRWSAGDDRILPHITVASQLTATDRETANLIAVGSPARNPIVDAVRSAHANLFNLPAAGTAPTVASPLTAHIGLLPSPWNTGAAVLVLTSISDDGIALASQPFQDPASLALLSGSVMALNGTLPPTSVQAGSRLTPERSGMVERFGWDRAATVVVIVAIVLLLIGAGQFSRRIVRRRS